MRTALRLLPLPFSIALCLPAMADDEKPESWALCPIQDVIPAFDGAAPPAASANPQLTREQRADQPTSIEGDSLGGTETNLEYQGNVALSRGDQFLGADNLKYDQENDTYVADGHIRYQDTGIRLIADSARGDQDADTHQIDNVRYQLVDRRGNGGADRIDMKGPQGSLQHSTYSTCDPQDRRWELRSRRIDINTDDGWGVARGATIRLGKVPVLYVPYLKFPIDDQRHTGLLYPAIGLSGRNGFDWKQPIYLNLAPNYDATLEPRYMSERGFQLGAEFRYLYENGRGEIQGTWMNKDDLVGDRLRDELARNPLYVPDEDEPDPDAGRGFFSYEGSHRFNRHWQARANLVWLSDARYQEDFGNSLYGQAYSSVTSTAGVYGAGEYWTAGLMADRWQLADYLSSESALPYNRLPRTYFNWNQPLSRWVTVGGHAEAVKFQHDEKAGGSRIDIKPTISLPIQGAAWYVTPTLAYRHTEYRLEADLAQTIATERARAAYGILPDQPVSAAQVAEFYDRSPSRSLPIGSLDAGVYFDRETEIKGDRFLQTLEPRLFYLNAPYREQDGLPIFDTRPFNFSYGQLFRDNRYTGPDRQTDANQLTLALSTRLLRQKDGFERLSASIGQIRYFEDSRVVLPGEVQLERGKSAWVADANYAPTDRWTIGASYQWDPKFRREDLASVRARYLLPDDGVVNLTYRRRRDLLEQADFSFLYPVTPAWSVVGRYYHSFYRDAATNQEPGLLEGVAGVQWDSCCLAVRALVRRYVRNREGDMNTGFQVEFVLKGLGSAGQDTDRTLRRAILGYYRDDLYLVPPSNIAPRPDDSTYAPDPMP